MQDTIIVARGAFRKDAILPFEAGGCMLDCGMNLALWKKAISDVRPTPVKPATPFAAQGVPPN